MSKKIMFNDKYGLTKAVLEGRKTMTRRIIPQLAKYKDPDISEIGINSKGKVYITNYDDVTDIYPRFQIGEKIAIAQNYKDVADYLRHQDKYKDAAKREIYYMSAGWNNKMFVKADLMPHAIEITNIKVEQLQDISDDDCMKEGIMEGEFMNTWDRYYYDEWGDVPNHITFKTPRKAFAALIDKVSGKGTWDSNPWCFCYEFKLIK